MTSKSRSKVNLILAQAAREKRRKELLLIPFKSLVDRAKLIAITGGKIMMIPFCILGYFA
jgi:hypothetical protein